MLLKKITGNRHRSDRLFSFINIGDKSLDIFFFKPLLSIPLILASYQLISDGINSNDYSNLPAKSVESLNKIAKFARKYNCIATFKLDDRSLASNYQRDNNK